MTDRRTFLKSALGAGIGAPLLANTAARVRHRDQLSILVIGGTRFLGPAIVEHALERGHSVTLFNRGRSNPDIFPHVEKLQGDRNEDLTVLEGHKWDAVIDTCGYFPRQVERMARQLDDSVGQYVFVSTLSVFPSEPGVFDESSAVATMTDEECEQATESQQITGANYGPLKARCEAAAERVLPGRTTNVRPGLIVGPRDNSDRFTYWPARIARGGEVLAPDNPNAEVQMIDVMDLGRWIVELCEHKTTGVFNAVGFDGPMTLQEVLHGCKVVLGANCTFTWVEGEFLAEHGVRPWSGPDSLPLWIPDDQTTFSNAKACGAGLTLRPLGDTIRATYEWSRTQPAKERIRAGLPANKEVEVLAAWHARESK